MKKTKAFENNQQLTNHAEIGINNQWKPLFEAIKAFPSNFMESRDQPEQQDREELP